MTKRATAKNTKKTSKPKARQRKTVAATGAVVAASTVLVLRTCAADLTSYGGFRWPESGPVAAPDWDSRAECGRGLHGLLWGEGAGSLLSWEPTAKWLVVEVQADQIVDLGGKVKFPRGTVVHCGTRETATAFLAERAHGRAIVGGTSTSGDGGTSTSGVGGTSTSGDRGTSTSGVGGTSTSGVGGTIVLSFWDTEARRKRLVVGYVGEDGIEPNVAYHLDEAHRFQRVTP